MGEVWARVQLKGSWLVWMGSGRDHPRLAMGRREEKQTDEVQSWIAIEVDETGADRRQESDEDGRDQGDMQNLNC